MLFTINSQDTILELKQKFMELFPGLKIELFREHHDAGEGSHKKEKYHVDVKLAQIKPDLETSTFIIEPHLTVAGVEKKFYEKLGLNVQIFRKMGRVWIETIHTDGYTLEKQMQLSADSQHR